MEIKQLVPILLLLTSSLGQDLTCTFSGFTLNGEPHYGCTLDIQNPEGFDNFTSISGTHNEGLTNSDVTVFLIHYESVTTSLPQIICSQFPNLLYIEVTFNQLQEIHEHTISGCRNLETLILWKNEIVRIHPRAFANNDKLINLDIDDNLLQTLDENIFTNLEQLRELEISSNPLTSIPSGLFSNLVNLNYLIMNNIEIDEISGQWFSDLRNLETLSLQYNKIAYIHETALANLTNLEILLINGNPIVDMSSGLFRGLPNLRQLYMFSTHIASLRREWFDALPNLTSLFLNECKFTSIPQNVFDGLTSLEYLNIDENHLTESAIPEDLFDSLGKLEQLSIRRNLIQTINPRWFQNLTSLIDLDFDFNSILELPSRIFASIPNLRMLSLWGNNIKTLNRNAFGNIENLSYLDLDENLINAIDEEFLSEATRLNYFYLLDNICINTRFIDFVPNRTEHMSQFALCTLNFRYTIDTETEAGAPYEFFEAPMTGIQFRVNGTEYIQIALSTANSMTDPMLELHIGCEGNTMSRIIRNQTETVVNIQTPRILNNDMWNGFRVTWANNVIMMSREAAQYPFITHTMEDVFPVNFMGLRSPNSNAIWSVQPVEPEIAPAVKSNVPKIVMSKHKSGFQKRKILTKLIVHST